MWIRNTMLYRRFRYVKKRHTARIHIYLRFVATIILFVIIVKYAEKTILPYMSNISEYRVKSAINILVNEAVQKTFSEKQRYDELVCINKNEKGEIEAITIDTPKINMLSAKIAQEIQQKINSRDTVLIKIPIGSLLGETILYNSGPSIYATVRQNGNIETEFISEFLEAGINQTKHRIVLSVKINVIVHTTFIKKNHIIINSIPIAETIIVGKVPAAYYAGGGK
ncbi:MAG TPA: sporulation protein YunB [Clostridiales bacterium]|nr:sporulation protein YunB [Clostridiales bacterium]